MLLTNILKKAYKIQTKPIIWCICSWGGSANTPNTCSVCVLSYRGNTSFQLDKCLREVLLNKNYFLRWLQTEAKEEIHMLSTITDMEGCQRYRFEEHSFFPCPTRLGWANQCWWGSWEQQNQTMVEKTLQSHWNRLMPQSGQQEDLGVSHNEAEGWKKIPKALEETTQQQVSSVSKPTSFYRLKVWTK